MKHEDWRNKLREKLGSAEDIGSVFKIAKKAVEEVLGIRRAGLELAIAEIQPNVDAVHPLGSNMIILSKKAIASICRSAKTRLELNCHIFLILLHEYLCSLGYLGEAEIRSLIMRVIGEMFEEDHVVHKIASRKYPMKHFELPQELSYSIEGDMELIRCDDDEKQYIT